MVRKATKRDKDKMKAYYEANKEEISAYRRDWHFKKKYGISLEDYDTLREGQKHRCYLCGVHEIVFGRNLCVDHNHETGQVRRLLCSKCNQGLGLFNDNPELLHRAAQYLETYGYSKRKLTQKPT